MITRTLALLVAAFASFASYALEVSDLHLPLKRTEADNTLTKDYAFQILTDGTIRRTWHISKRQVSVDFDPADDSAICITITYTNPVSRKTAEADADALASDTEAKWKKTKPDAVERVGIPVGSSIKEFEDKSMMFLELSETKKHKYDAVSYFSKAPHKNRKELQAVDADQSTAMGATSMAADVKFLFSDEKARQEAAGAAPIATSSTKSPAVTEDDDSDDSVSAETTVTMTVKPKQATPAPATNTAPSTPVAATTASAQPRVQTSGLTAEEDAQIQNARPGETVTIMRKLGDDTGEAPGTVSAHFKKFDGGEENEEYGNLVDVAKSKLSPAELCIGAAVILVLLFLIFSSAARSRAKKRQKANFASIIVSSPAGARKVASKKKPVIKKR